MRSIFNIRCRWCIWIFIHSLPLHTSSHLFQFCPRFNMSIMARLSWDWVRDSMELASEGSFLPSPGRTRPPRFSHVIFELTSAIYLSPKERNKWKSSDVLIRVRFGPHDLTFLKVFPIYQIVLLFYRRVCVIKICFYFFFYFVSLIGSIAVWRQKVTLCID